MVVGLIPAPQPPEDGQGLVPGGLTHGDRLEAALQGGVLFNILAVLVQGGGSNHLDLSPGEGWLQNVGRVNSPLGAARPHNGVELVNKEDHIARPAHFLEYVLELLLKFPPVLGARHHSGQIQRTHPLAQQVGRGGAVGNGQG